MAAAADSTGIGKLETRVHTINTIEFNRLTSTCYSLINSVLAGCLSLMNSMNGHKRC
jgi:hypothetical protein